MLRDGDKPKKVVRAVNGIALWVVCLGALAIAISTDRSLKYNDLELEVVERIGVSFPELLSRFKYFEGRKVRLIGCAVLEFEHQAIYPSAWDLKNYIFTNRINLRIDFDTELKALEQSFIEILPDPVESAELQETENFFNRKLVVVEGTFSRHSASGMFANGFLRDISSLELRGDCDS